VKAPISDADIRRDGYTSGFRDGWHEAFDYLAGIKDDARRLAVIRSVEVRQ
jgi:hypothetical protein